MVGTGHGRADAADGGHASGRFLQALPVKAVHAVTFGNFSTICDRTYLA
jgi:hypothetical protein